MPTSGAYPPTSFQIDPDKQEFSKHIVTEYFGYRANGTEWIGDHFLKAVSLSGWSVGSSVDPYAHFAPFPLIFWPMASGVTLPANKKTLTDGQPLAIFLPLGQRQKVLLAYDPGTQILNLSSNRFEADYGLVPWKMLKASDGFTWQDAAAQALVALMADWGVGYKEIEGLPGWWEFTATAPDSGIGFNDFQLYLNLGFGFNGPDPPASYGGGVVCTSAANGTQNGEFKGEFSLMVAPSRWQQMTVDYYGVPPDFLGVRSASWLLSIGDDVIRPAGLFNAWGTVDTGDEVIYRGGVVVYVNENHPPDPVFGTDGTGGLAPPPGPPVTTGRYPIGLGYIMASDFQIAILDSSTDDYPGMFAAPLLGGKSLFVSSLFVPKDQYGYIHEAIIAVGPGNTKQSLSFIGGTPVVLNMNGSTFTSSAIVGRGMMPDTICSCLLPAVDDSKAMVNYGGGLFRTWDSVYLEMPGYPDKDSPSRILGKVWNSMLAHLNVQLNAQISREDSDGKTTTFHCISTQLGGTGMFGTQGSQCSLWLAQFRKPTPKDFGGSKGGALVITSPAPPDGAVGTPYSFTFNSSGGTGFVSWALLGGRGGFPPGLDLDDNILTGTPTTAGSYTFRIQVNDTAGAMAWAEYTVQITTGLVITSGAPPNGTVGTPYTFTFTASGGTLPLFWSAPRSFAGGSIQRLPPGLNVANGVLSGTPNTAGSYTFVLTVTDSDERKANATYTIAIVESAGALKITSGAPPTGRMGIAYSFTFTASAAVTWSFIGNLPEGLSLTGAVLAGSPSAAGAFTFRIIATDSLGQAAQASYTLSISTQPPALTITSASPPDGKVAVAYSFTFSASVSVTWSSSGNIPDGLSLSGATLAGDPTTPGLYDFTITATNALGATVAANYSISIATTVTDWAITVPNLPHALISGGGYLWVGTETQPGSLTRIDPATGQYQTFFFPDDGAHQWLMDLIYLPSKGKVYCLFGHPLDNSFNVATVAEVDPDTMAYTNVITDLTYNPEQGSFCADANYLYIGSRSYSRLYRYNLTTWARAGDLDLGMIPLVHAVRYDPITDKVYATSADIGSPGLPCIARIDPATFTVEQYAATAPGDSVLTDDFAMTADYVWCGSELSSKITRVRKDNLNSQTVIYIPEVAGTRCVCVFWDGTYIWGAWWSFPGKIVRIDPVTLAYTVFTTPYDAPNEIWSDNANGGQAGATITGAAAKLYLTSYLNPGKAYSFTL